MRTRMDRGWGVIIGVLAGAALAPAALGSVIINQRGPVLAGQWNATNQVYLGAFGAFSTNSYVDAQVADDFVLGSATQLTGVTVDFTVGTPGTGFPPSINNPADGFFIEVFPDIGGRPSEVPTVQRTVLSYANLGAFPGTSSLAIAPASNAPMRATFAIDLTSANVTLGAGTWWISVQPVDWSPFGQVYLWASTQDFTNGSAAHRRSGGIDHGTGYPAQFNANDWTVNEAGFVFRGRELSFSLDGTPILGACYANCDASTQPPVLNVGDFTCFLQKYTAGDAYANCDGSTQAPVLNVGDFTCFLQKYTAGDAYANCDASTQPPVLNVADFTCFLQKYTAGCR